MLEYQNECRIGLFEYSSSEHRIFDRIVRAIGFVDSVRIAMPVPPAHPLPDAYAAILKSLAQSIGARSVLPDVDGTWISHTEHGEVKSGDEVLSPCGEVNRPDLDRLLATLRHVNVTVPGINWLTPQSPGRA